MVVILYHGTPYPTQVLEQGLVPNKKDAMSCSREGYVYLARDARVADSFGHVLEARVPEEWELEWDPELPEEGVIYEGTISPDKIELYDDAVESVASCLPEDEEIPEQEIEGVLRASLNENTVPITEAIDGYRNQ